MTKDMNNKFFNIVGFLWAVMVLLLLWSCQSEPKGLSSEERYVVDTMYSNRVAAFRVEADSLCKVFHSQNYDRVRDSLQLETLKEIELLLNKKLLME